MPLVERLQKYVDEENRLAKVRREEAAMTPRELATKREAEANAASMKLLKDTRTIEMLNEIAGSVPGAKVKIEKNRSGTGEGLNASVTWEREVDVVDTYTREQSRARMKYGIEIDYLSSPDDVDHPEGSLFVENIGGTGGMSLQSDDDDIRGQLEESLRLQLDRTGKQVMVSSAPGTSTHGESYDWSPQTGNY